MFTIAIDFGGTRIKAGVVRDGRVAALRVLDAESRGGLVARLPVIVDAVRDVCAEAGTTIAACAGIGVALWRAPDTVSIPVGASPESLPAPMPAPPNLADASPAADG